MKPLLIKIIQLTQGHFIINIFSMAVPVKVSLLTTSIHLNLGPTVA